ncbi:MAG: M16 family metallopeptidase [Gemmatimonadota bacterium]
MKTPERNAAGGHSADRNPSAEGRSERATPPAPGPIRPFEFPAVEKIPLENGLDLRVVRAANLPMVHVNLFMRAGEDGLLPERAGLAVLAGDALEGGTRRRSGTELAEALEGIGARLSVSTGWEGTSVSLSCLADRLEKGMELLAEAVLEPAFPEKEVRRAREQQLARIRQRSMDPASLASEAAARVIFAPDVPYARPRIGSRESVEGLTRDHLRGYADACWRPGRGGLVVAGDVDAGEVETLVRTTLGGWSGAPSCSGDFQVRAAEAKSRMVLVDRPGSVQSEIRVGHVGAARTDPDVDVLRVVNTLFGGSFTSRLNLNLRERHGFTYGVRSRFALRSRPGPFIISTAVGTDVSGAAVGEILAELEALADAGPVEEEVTAARDYLAGVFPLRLETVGQLAARVAELIVYGLPDDEYSTYRDRIRAVSTDAAARTARRRFRPRDARVVVVGDAETVRSQLEDLGLGEVEVENPL